MIIYYPNCIIQTTYIQILKTKLKMRTSTSFFSKRQTPNAHFNRYKSKIIPRSGNLLESQKSYLPRCKKGAEFLNVKLRASAKGSFREDAKSKPKKKTGARRKKGNEWIVSWMAVQMLGTSLQLSFFPCLALALSWFRAGNQRSQKSIFQASFLPCTPRAD